MTERTDAGTATLEPAVAALAGCPHLVSVDGPWHAATPSRAHRCRLLAEGRPTLERQQGFCLGAAHVDCPTWVEVHGASGPPSRPGPFVPTAPVVLEGPGIGLSANAARRRITPPITIAIVGVALGALVLARGPLAPGTSDAGNEAPSSGPSGAVVPASAAPQSPGTPGATAAATARPTARPTATPGPAATPRPRTYKVRPGDTLGRIAASFGTTVDQIARLNGIKNASLIRVGQVLQIP